MTITPYTVQVLIAAEGYTLTQSADVPLLERILDKKIYLAVNDSPENWTEITDAEADEIRRQQEEAEPQPEESV